MKTVTVPSSTDDSIKLQKLIDSTGNTPSEFIFSDGDIEIKSLLRLYNFTKWNGANFHLMDNAPVSPFAVQVPLIGSKYKTGITGLEFCNIKFDGHYKTQKYSIAKCGTDHGKGYHNFIGLGDVGNPLFSNVTNCSFHDIIAGYNQGDEIRIEGGSNIKVWNLKSKFGGHDIIHGNCIRDSEIFNCDVNTRANNFVRLRSSNNVSVHDNIMDGTGTYAPPLQVESIVKNHVSSDIFIQNNVIKNALGPGIWVIGTVPFNTGIRIDHNLIYKCGQMPNANKIPGVGGIAFDGFDGVTIDNNTIDQCRGYGILAGNYLMSSTSKGKAVIQKNIITRTQVSYYPGSMSGYGIADLTGGRYSITSDENCLYGNLGNCYKVTSTNDIKLDPRYVSTADYHLQSVSGHYSTGGVICDSVSSPCVMQDHELGCYGGTSEASCFRPAEPPAELPAIVIPAKNETDLRNFYTALLKSGLLEEGDKVEFIHVSTDFTV